MAISATCIHCGEDGVWGHKDREGGLLPHTHDPRDCARPCTVHPARRGPAPMTPETPAGSATETAKKLPLINVDGPKRYADALEGLMQPLALATRQINAAPALYALVARLVAWYDTHMDPAQPMDAHAACELRALVDEARKINAQVESA